MFNISLLLSAAVIIICVLANKLSNKIGMPVLIAFIALGMVFGSDGILKIPFENYSFANSTEEEIALNSKTMIQKRQAVPHP